MTRYLNLLMLREVLMKTKLGYFLDIIMLVYLVDANHNNTKLEIREAVH